LKTTTPFSQLSDNELLTQFVKTSEQEFLGQLYARYIPLVYGLCLKYLQQTEDAEDAVVHIYEELNKKLANYQIDNFKAWLYTFTKNHCLQVLRKNKSVSFEEIVPQIMELGDFEHLLEVENDKEKMDALHYCLETLSEEQKKCITHFFFDEFSYIDIVEKTGFALNKVKSYIQNGKRNLQICILKKINH